MSVQEMDRGDACEVWTVILGSVFERRIRRREDVLFKSCSRKESKRSPFLLPPQHLSHSEPLLEK